MKKNTVCVSFLGNILFDTRTLNLYKSFKAQNYDVQVICFDWRGSNDSVDDEYVKCYPLKKKSSLLFYLNFSALLFSNLLKSNASIFFAEDIYTLPFVCIAAKLKRAKVFYDSRELFGFLAGLTGKKTIQKLLAAIEKYFIKMSDLVIVTGDMDGEFLKKQYGISNLLTIRNLPFYIENITAVNLHKKYNIDDSKKILLYQGVILHGRGLEHIFNALQSTSEFVLLIIGDGEHKTYYENLAKEMGIQSKAIFAGRINQEELLNYSAGADIGLSLIENISVSYYYALPNKLFEYIMAGLPVAVSRLPQMEKVVNDYDVGVCVNLEKEDELLLKLNETINDRVVYGKYKANTRAASKELNWDTEIKKLFSILN